MKYRAISSAHSVPRLFLARDAQVRTRRMFVLMRIISIGAVCVRARLFAAFHQRRSRAQTRYRAETTRERRAINVARVCECYYLQLFQLAESSSL